MTEDVTRLADLPARWEAEAAEIDERREAGEISGEVWEARYEILMENAIDLRDSLYQETQSEHDGNHRVPSSAMRLLDWLADHAYPEPKPESNDICDWALAKLVELEELVRKLTPEVDTPETFGTIEQ